MVHERTAKCNGHQAAQDMQAVAQAEGLTLVVAGNTTGYFGVRFSKSKRSTPFRAHVRRGGRNAHLGYFNTAEEAALCVARTPERRAAAERAAAPSTSKQALQQAQAEGLTLHKTDNSTGYFGVYHKNAYKTYEARVRHGGKNAYLGSFATAEEAALCVARSSGGQARAAAAAPLTSEEALQEAQAEGLALRVAKSKTGHFGVYHLSGRPKPYMVRAQRGGKQVHLGSFVTAEEAALCYARSLGVQAAAERTSAAGPPLTSKEGLQQAQAEGLTLVIKTGEDNAGEEDEEDFEVLDAVEVLDAWTDDDDY